MKTFAICIIAALASGCGVTIRSQSQASHDNLSGVYRYAGLGSHSADEFPNPLVEFSDITHPCDVEVIHQGHLFKTVYKSHTGSLVSRTLDLSKKQKGITWENCELVTTQRVPVTGPVILPLPGMHERGTRVLRDSNGNLAFVGFFREAGLFWTDYSEEEIVLKKKKN